MSTPDAVQLLVDRDEIHDVVMRYAVGVDGRDMEMVRGCFAPDLEVEGWGGGFADRDSMITYISGVAIFHTTMHMFGNQYIEVDGDTAHVDTYAMLTHHSDDAHGVTHELNVSRGRYVEDLTRRRGPLGHHAARWGAGVGTHGRHARHVRTTRTVQWLLDRAEIHDLMMQYALGVDLRDYDRIRNCFASSFRASYGAREFTDADELIEFISGVEHFPSTTHFLGTQLIGVDGDEAWMQTYSLITHRPDEEDATSRLGRRRRVRRSLGTRGRPLADRRTWTLGTARRARSRSARAGERRSAGAVSPRPRRDPRRDRDVGDQSRPGGRADATLPQQRAHRHRRRRCHGR